MKTRAAIAVAPNQPLEIHEVDLDGPRAGEVLYCAAQPLLRTRATALHSVRPPAGSACP